MRWRLPCSISQANIRKNTEASVSLLEKDKIMLQHRFTEYQRKADQEAEKRRNLENEGKPAHSPCAIKQWYCYWRLVVNLNHVKVCLKLQKKCNAHINVSICFCSVNFKGAAWRYEKDQPKLTGLKWQNYPTAESGTQ